MTKIAFEQNGKGRRIMPLITENEAKNGSIVWIYEVGTKKLICSMVKAGKQINTMQVQSYLKDKPVPGATVKI